MSLRNKTISGVKWTTLSMIVVTGTQLLQLLILSRFLLPTDFGLMAIMMVVIGFSQVFMDMGISNAIIQRQEISHNQLSSLYWLNIASGFVLFGVMIILAPIIADFYEEPGLLNPLLLHSSVFIILSIGNQYRILCQKEMQFNLIAKVEIGASIVSLTVAVFSAVKGWGVYALVWGVLAQATVSSLFYLLIGLKIHHRPALVYHNKDLQSFYSFGLYQMGEKFLDYFGANIDKLIIGKFFGMEAVGFYNMAWQLIIFPLVKINPIINKVVFPIYAKMQDDTQALDRYYTLTVRLLSLVTVPFLAFLSLFSQEIVLLVLGEGWETTATLVGILSLLGILKAVGSPGGSLLLALGYAKITFYWGFFWTTMSTIILVVTVLFSSELIYIPIALILLTLTVGNVWHYIVAKVAAVKYNDLIFNFIKITFVCFIIALLSRTFVDILNLLTPILRVLTGLTIYLFFYLTYLIIFERKLLVKN